MPKVVFSTHAETQLRERLISEDEVHSAFEKPDRIIKQSSGRLLLVKTIKRMGKRYLLMVVYEEINSIFEVVTVFRTSKIKKYL